MTAFNYDVDGETLARFFASDAFVRGIRGPVGSGKSVAGCIEIFRRAVAQEPSPIDGLQKTRWAVIRNTQPELKTTTIKTWLDWFPEEQYGKFNWSPPFTHYIKRGKLDMEVIFLALDKPEDVKKLLSLELTGAFMNEAREANKQILDGTTMRVGRYPSQRDGGPTWSGVIMDTNSPDEDHWWAIMSGEVPPPDWMSPEELSQMVKPADWEFFTQPAAMLSHLNKETGLTEYTDNPLRENQVGLPAGYYERMVAGKSKAWLDVYVANKYGSLTDGKPVYRDFDKKLHVASEPFPVFTGQTVYVGIDFGLSPAAILGQKYRGRWYIHKEIVAKDMGIERFSSLLKEAMASMPTNDFSIWGDPAGDQRAQTDEDTPFKILRSKGVMARPTDTNDPALRIDAATAPLNRLVEKKPGILINPECKVLIKGFEDGYHYRRMQVTGTERFDTSPNKNRFSHPHDAFQYMMLGGGEGKLLTRSGTPSKVVVKKKNWDVFGQKRRIERPNSLKNW